LNKSALKTFAQDARNKLRQLIGARLDYVLTADTAELRQQAAQVNELRAALKTEGRDPLIERVAYTWFNRLAALRFMDANGYHPFGARAITPATANETLPELLQQARAGALDADFKSQIANPKTFDDLLAGRIPVDHPEAQVFKLLLVAACNYYHRLMPFLFEKIGDATELLLPDDLLTEYSIVADFRENLTDEDCQNEEVLGWFYQYYISEKKTEVMARNAAVPKQDIPAVTQLFTPHWIVRYLVENSLGRLWLLNRPHSKLREKMPYYIEGEPEKDFLKISKPEDIRLLDPAGGSGHMLTYAFDVLYAIYEEEGYDAPEIPGLILRHNLYGVDICDRAMALAAFALCMKARAKDNRFFRRAVQPNLLSLQEIRFEEGELSPYFKTIGLQPSAIHPQLTKLLYQFEEAKNFGALIQPCLSESEIVAVREKLSTLNRQLSTRDLAFALTQAKTLRILEQSEYLSQRYHVVVANPPYMGSGNFNAPLRAGLEDRFKVTRTDLYAIFMERSADFVVSNGFLGMVAMQSWMFTSSYIELREKLLARYRLVTLAQLGARAFESIAGEIVATSMFCIQRTSPTKSRSIFIRLTDGDASEKETRFHDANRRFTFCQVEFKRVPGSPMVYWKGLLLIELYEQLPPVGKLALFREGIHTGDNGTFLRQWWEISDGRFGRNETSFESISASGIRWLPYNKGGGCIRWYGNYEYVIAFDQQSRDAMEQLQGHVRPSQSIYFKQGGTWSDVGTKGFGVKFYPSGFLFDAKGPVCVGDNIEVLIAGLNSVPFTYLSELLMPTISYKCGTVKTIPFPKLSDHPPVEEIGRSAISLARTDWDNIENSWDFRDLPLLRPGLKGKTLAASWQNWKAQCDDAIRRMRELETENNRHFIAAYGLQDELAPEVPDEQITLARAEARNDMAEFLSYAIGCMFGRYSLDQPGLILADAGATAQDYLACIPQPTFAPDADGILPVLDGEWFQDDIVGRFREFLRVTYGEENLAENLAFIESSLGKPDAKTGRAKPTDLRTYFVRDFYKEHLKTYKKRPIYWMFSSPEGSFQALIYLHRYNRDSVNLLLNDYVREFIGKLEEKHRQHTSVTLNESARPGDRTKAAKELVKFDKMLKEIKGWERDVLLPLAQQRIELDLDDGVKVNYLKFKGAVVNIPGLDKGDEE
jgi:Eco57I restriction-modification methylase